MSLEALSKHLVDAVSVFVLEKNPEDETLYANTTNAIVDYFHVEVGVQRELLLQLVKKIELDNGITERLLVKPAK